MVTEKSRYSLKERSDDSLGKFDYGTSLPTTFCISGSTRLHEDPVGSILDQASSIRKGMRDLSPARIASSKLDQHSHLDS